MRKTIILLLVILYSFAGCIHEPSPSCEVESQFDATFILEVPSQNNFDDEKLISKSMTLDEEKRVVRVDILAFKNDNGVERFAYHTKAKSIDNTEPSKKTITATILSGGDAQYRFVLLANLTDAQGDALASSEVLTPKDVLLSSILFSNTGIWGSNQPKGLTPVPIPMWGESTPIVVTSEVATGGITGIKLVRMVAKFDITLTTSEAMGIFSLEEVYLYNRKSRGNVVPDPSKWNSPHVTSATIPPDNDPENPLTIVEPQLYDEASTPGVAFVNTIYTFEAVGPPQGKYSDATCFVVGGKFNFELRNSYYRIDLTSVDGKTFRDMLRNHYYKINITKILDRGYETPDEAFNSIPTNIETEILAWDLSKSVNAVSDGQYILNVSEDLFTFSKESRSLLDDDNKLSIFTDHPYGWEVSEIIDDGNNPISWLYVDAPDQSGAAMLKKTVSLKADYNDTGMERTGHLLVTAGRMSYDVVVKQGITGFLAISLKDLDHKDISELIFPSNVGQPQSSIPAKSFVVRWKPFINNNPCSFNTTQIGDLPFDYGDGTAIANSGSLINAYGAVEYINIQPKPFTPAEVAEDGTGNPFLEKTSRVDFTVSDGMNSKYKSLILTQINYAAVPTVKPFYLLNGTTGTFNLKSNTLWKVTLKEDPKNVVEHFDPATGGYDVVFGQEIEFTLKDKINTLDVIDAQVVFTVESTDPNRYFSPRDITIDCFAGVEVETSNCYVVKPDGMPLIIPITQYKRTFTMLQGALPQDWIKPNDAIEAKFMWTDNPKVVERTSTIRAYMGVGKGDDGFIFVAPGSSEGNAVIAATVDGVVKWSWHIWVTDYNPGDGSAASDTEGAYPVANGNIYRFINNNPINVVIMDRNLGAFSADEGDVKTQGLMYQWGRKDPFIGKGDWNDDAQERLIYNESESFIMPKIDKGATGMGGNNTHYAINNPEKFIYTALDWTIRGDNLWWYDGSSMPSNYKTAFDPCPKGWALPITYTFYGLNFNPADEFEVTPGLHGLVPTGPKASMGFLPMTGMRGSTGNFQGVGVSGNTWTYQPTGANADSPDYTFTTFTTNTVNRAVGATVRCIKYNGIEH